MFALDAKTMQRIAPVVRRVLIVDPNPAAARLLSDPTNPLRVMIAAWFS